jgi:hypothetical protein
MSVTRPVRPLSLHQTTACPRCDGLRSFALSVSPDSLFAWHERHQCGHLWAIPQGWEAAHEISLSQLPKRGTA